MRDSKVRAFSAEMLGLLESWISSLPPAGPSARDWYRELLDSDPEVVRAMGLPADRRGLDAAKTFIESDAPSFRQWQSGLNQRMQIYLGGVEGLAQGIGTETELGRQRAKIRALRQMLSHQSRSWPRQPRTLATVTAAVASGSLHEFWTSEADSDLWVVLKTLQEHIGNERARDSLIALLEWVVDVVHADAAHPRQHISDRRHAWWAVRTLYQGQTFSLYSTDDDVLDNYLQQLLSEPIYVPNTVAISSSLVPEFHERIAVGWELVNISELLRGPERVSLKFSALSALQDREDLLIEDVVADEKPVDMRVATVYARAAMTFLSDECPVLWGKDV